MNLSIFVCFQVTAIESRLRLAAAQQTTKQNLDISTLELSYLIDGVKFHDNFDLQWHIAFNLGKLAIDADISLPAERVNQSLDRIMEWRGKLFALITDPSILVINLPLG